MLTSPADTPEERDRISGRLASATGAVDDIDASTVSVTGIELLERNLFLTGGPTPAERAAFWCASRFQASILHPLWSSSRHFGHWQTTSTFRPPGVYVTLS